MFDTKKDLIVWVGKDASQNEKKNAMTYAHVSGNVYIVNTNVFLGILHCYQKHFPYTKALWL